MLNEGAKGVFVISATPFTDSGEIDYGSIDALLERLERALNRLRQC